MLEGFSVGAEDSSKLVLREWLKPVAVCTRRASETEKEWPERWTVVSSSDSNTHLLGWTGDMPLNPDGAVSRELVVIMSYESQKLVFLPTTAHRIRQQQP